MIRLKPWLLAAAVVLACHKKPLPAAVQLSFLDPTAGQTISRANDVDAALDGIQLNVKVGVSHLAAGQRVSLTIAGSTVSALPSAGIALFPAVTVPIGETTVTASAAGVSAAIVIMVVVDSGALCAFVSPRDGDTLTAADNKNSGQSEFRTNLVISCEGLSAGTVVSLDVQTRPAATVKLDDNGRAELDGVDLAEGPNVIDLTAKGLTGPVEITVTVNTGRCLASLIPPDAITFLYDGVRDPLGGTLAPVRTLTLNTTCPAGSTATLTLSGTVFDSAAPTTNCQIAQTREYTAIVGPGVTGNTAAFSAAKLLQGTTIANAGVGALGSPEGQALPNSYLVDTYPPRIVSTYPDTGDDLSLVDLDPKTPGLQTTITVKMVGVEPGTLQIVKITDAGGNVQILSAPAALANPSGANCFDQTQALGGFSIPGVTISDGNATLVYDIADQAGNVVTHEADLIIATQVPSLAIASPLSATTLVASDDVDNAKAGLQSNFAIAIAGVANLNGRAGAVIVPGQNPTNFVYSGNPQTVEVTLVDGNPLTGIYATVTMANGKTFQSPAISLVVDSVVPALEVQTPVDGAAEVTGTTAVNFDLQLGLEQQDQLVTISSSGTTLATATASAGSLTCHGGDPAGTCELTGVPVVAGMNVFTVQVQNNVLGTKHNITSQTIHVYVASGPPSIAFTQVNGQTVTGATTSVTLSQDSNATLADGFDVNVQAQVNAVPGEALVQLAHTPNSGLDGAVTSPTAADIWISRYVTIPSAAALSLTTLNLALPIASGQTLWLQVTDALGTPSGWVELGVDDSAAGGGDVEITVPAYAADLGSLPMTVTLYTTVASAQTCNLYLDADQVGTPPGTAVNASPITLPGGTPGTVSLAISPSGLSDGAHSLLAACATGGSAPSSFSNPLPAGTSLSERQVFNYRAGTPTFVFVDGIGILLNSATPTNEYINDQSVDTSSAAGYQVNVTVALNEPDGTAVQLGVQTCANPPSCSTLNARASYSATVIGGLATFANVTVSANGQPAGEQIAMVAQLAGGDFVHAKSDGFGAAIAPLTRTPQVKVVAPTVTMTTPGQCPVVVALYNPLDNPTTVPIEWQATYTVTGVADGTTLTTTVALPSGPNQFLTANVVGGVATVNFAFAIPNPPAAYAVGITASAMDAANNTGASATCSSTVDPTVPVLHLQTTHKSFVDPSLPQTPPTVTLNSKDDEVGSQAGIQASFYVTTQNLSAGSLVDLCSTSSDPSLASAGACAHVQGKILATAIIPSPLQQGNEGFASLPAVNVVDGSYSLAVEVIDSSTGKFATSPVQPNSGTLTYAVVVDSQPPPTASIGFTTNAVCNDAAGAINLGANISNCAGGVMAEGTVNGSGAGATLTNNIVITLTPSSGTTVVAGVVASLQSSLQNLGPLTATLGASPSTFSNTPPLVQGVHTLTLTLTTPDGNTTTTTQQVDIDLVPPVVAIAAQSPVPFICPSPGTCVAGGGVTSAIDVTVTDNANLGGGCVCLTANSSPCLGTCPSGLSGVILPAGTSSTDALTSALAEHTNNVGAYATDAVGNQASETSVLYLVDTIATSSLPVLTINPANESGASCTSAPGCVLNGPACPSAPPNSNCANWQEANTFEVTALGAAPGGAACVSTNGGCRYGLELLGRPQGGTTFQQIYQGTVSGLTADANAVSLDSRTGGIPAIPRGSAWEFQLKVTDQNGNFETSASTFVQLSGFNGVAINLEKGFDQPLASELNDGSQVGQSINQGSTLGVRHNHNGAAMPFVTDLEALATWSGVTPVAGDCAQLKVGGVVVASALTAGQVTETLSFANIALASSGNTIEVDVYDTTPPGSCAGVLSTLGATTVTNVSALTNLPTVAFNFPWRKTADLAFNAPGDVGAVPTAAPTFTAASDGNTASPGFQFKNGESPEIDVGNAGNGSISLATDNVLALGGITSVSVPSGASSTVALDPSLTIYSAHTAASPPGVATQVITAKACNTADDCVTTTAGAVGVATSLHVQVDVDPPATVTATACLGESDVPTGVSDPASYTDVAACTTDCQSSGVCDRRKGNAVLHFAAPGDDGVGGGTVTAYNVAVAIIDQTVPSPADCQTLFTNGAGPGKSSTFYWPGVIAVDGNGNPNKVASGQTQYLRLQHLPLHQRLCFAVLAQDDVGNLAAITASSSAVRVIPLLQVTSVSPPLPPFDRQTSPTDRPLDTLPTGGPAEPSFATLAGEYPEAAVLIGDMDGDGFAEFAVASAGSSGNVRIFSSRRTQAGNYAARRTITSTSSTFGAAMVAGDFNGDGVPDLAIGDPNALDPTDSGGTKSSGAVYVYYGAGPPGTGNGEPDVLQLTSCPALFSMPTPSCPQAIFYGTKGSQVGSTLAAGNTMHNVSNAPSDLLIGAGTDNARTGAAFLAAAHSSFFPSANPVATATVNLDSAPPAGVTNFSPSSCAAPASQFLSFGSVGLAIADMDGDGLGDVIISGLNPAACQDTAQFFYPGRATWPATVATTAASRCDTIAGSHIFGPNTQNLGAIVAGSSPQPQSLLVRTGAGSSVFLYQGNAGFYGSSSSTCAPPAVLAGALPPGDVATLVPVTAFGPLLDNECNAALYANIFTGAVDLLSSPSSAAPVGDFDGDGIPDFVLGLDGGGGSGAAGNGRVIIATLRPPSACAVGNPASIRVLAELTGNGTAGWSMGNIAFGLGNHLGSGPPAIAGVGPQDASNMGIWIFK